MRKNGKRPAAKRRTQIGSAGIISAAERLFAKHGVNNVSLSQISKEAGLANLYSVQYHFEHRTGLLKAIFEKRLPEFEERRKELLGKYRASKDKNINRYLFDCLCRPFLENALDDKDFCFASIMIEVVRDRDLMSLRAGLSKLTPVSNQITHELRANLRFDEDVFYFRLFVSFSIMLDVISNAGWWSVRR